MSPLRTSLLESIAAEAVREGLADAIYTRLPSPLGTLLVVRGAEGIVRVAFEEEPEDAVLAGVAAGLGPRVIGSDAQLGAERDALSGYLEGDVQELLMPVDLQLVSGPFRRAALDALHGTVARGETVSYGELAARAGHPRAARAAGSACARNPIPLIVPCHRVLPGTGALGNYAGGPARKRTLLALEGVRNFG